MMLTSFNQARRLKAKKKEVYCPQRISPRDELMSWEPFSPILGTADVPHQNVPALIKDKLVDIPVGTMMIAVQTFMGVSAQHPYTSSSYYYVSDDSAFIEKTQARRTMQALLENKYGISAAWEDVCMLCHGERYVQLDKGLMMMRAHGITGTRAILSAEEAFGAKSALPVTPGLIATPIESDIPPAAVIEQTAPRRPLLSVPKRVAA